MNKKYILSTGEIDRKRLTLLSKLYNPPALNFLATNGLKPGMHVLEVGCGTGHMSCALAKHVGLSGKVIAIDNSESQLNIAKETAKALRVTNIDFHLCDVFDLAKLGLNYDATYGRWVIEFTQNPKLALETMHKHLNPGGILAYEATNTEQTAFFFLPTSSLH